MAGAGVLKEALKARIGEAAACVKNGACNSCCCGGAPAGFGGSAPITSNLYDASQAGEVPAALRRNMELGVGCVAGALSGADYLTKLTAAGFDAAKIKVTRV